MKWWATRFAVGTIGLSSLTWTAAAQAQRACMSDMDCPIATCGGQVCSWPAMVCVDPAPTDGAAPDIGWCMTDANCKCRALGATCLPPSSGAMGHCADSMGNSLVTPPATATDGGAETGAPIDSGARDSANLDAPSGDATTTVEAGIDAARPSGSSSGGGSSSSSGSGSGSGGSSSSSGGSGGGSSGGCSSAGSAPASAARLEVLALVGCIVVARRRQRVSHQRVSHKRPAAEKRR